MTGGNPEEKDNSPSEGSLVGDNRKDKNLTESLDLKNFVKFNLIKLGRILARKEFCHHVVFEEEGQDKGLPYPQTKLPR